MSMKSRFVKHTLGTFAIVGLFFVGLGLFQMGDHLVQKTPEGNGPLVALSENLLKVTEGGDVFTPPPAPEPPKLPERTEESKDLDPDVFSAASILVKDTESGMVLFEKNMYDQRPIASITKLMSSLLLLEQGFEWQATSTVVSDNLIDTHMYAGDTYTIEELWQAALVGSSNKAIMTLADYVGWTREAFVARMNERARELGMGNTHFAEPTGLDAGNASTASDITILLGEALAHKDLQEGLLQRELNLYSAEREKKHHMWSTNWLLLGWVPHQFDLIGGKTGYIDASGYNFTVRLSDDAGHTVDIVVLGAESHEARFTEARDAADWAFDAYMWPDEHEELAEEKEEDTTQDT